TEAASIVGSSEASGATLGTGDAERASRLGRLAEAVHRHDARIFVQLRLAGRENGTLAQHFARAALSCQRAGIDGVELHWAQGPGLNQLLSPTPADDYSCDFEKKMRFTKEVIEGIRTACGKDYPIIIRLIVDEFVEGGIFLEEGIMIAQYMENIGVDAISVSCGTYKSVRSVIERAPYYQGWRGYLSEAVKKAVKIPVIGVGLVHEPAFAEEVIREKKSDFVAIGLGLIADPHWCTKASSGKAAEIRQCNSCLQCLDDGLRGVRIDCTAAA
ncbi:MAG: NADH:flavin oxidoreductase, partial [Desulfuromonadales bacterium]|nr:NADH:flavin oxidoreductase [Desulfuromonadales bacterium]